MTFYISARPLRYDGKLITPKEHLKYNFTGIVYTWKPVCWNDSIDGRILYEITLDEGYTEGEAEELRAVFVEALAMFGAHLKSSTTSAKELAEKITEVTWDVVEDKIAVHVGE